jgi:DNA-binding transcriptional LysR family regulator
LNTEQFRYFELAYHERNFSAAARLVPCSPQGLAKAIHSLEKELGVELFTSDETGKPVPTEYAHEFLSFTAVYDSNVRLLQESFDRIRGQEHARIRLGCSLGVLGTFGPSFMDDFAAGYPAIEVAQWEMSDALCDRGLLDNNFDMALVLDPYPQAAHVQELYRAPVYFWVHSESPLARLEHLTFADLAGQDVAIPGTGFKCYDRLRAGVAEAGGKLGGVYEMSEVFQLYEFAASGRGLGFSVRHLVELPTFNRLDSVVALPVQGFPWAFGVAHLQTHALTAAERTFWDWCVLRARDL